MNGLGRDLALHEIEQLLDADARRDQSELEHARARRKQERSRATPPSQALVGSALRHRRVVVMAGHRHV